MTAVTDEESSSMLITEYSARIQLFVLNPASTKELAIFIWSSYITSLGLKFFLL